MIAWSREYSSRKYFEDDAVGIIFSSGRLGFIEALRGAKSGQMRGMSLFV